jgi:hypothetical protein
MPSRTRVLATNQLTSLGNHQYRKDLCSMI